MHSRLTMGNSRGQQILWPQNRSEPGGTLHDSTSQPSHAFTQAGNVSLGVDYGQGSMTQNLYFHQGVMDALQMPVYAVLENACRGQHWELVATLINAGANVNTRFRESTFGLVCALHAACYYSQWDMVEFLLKKGANPNIVSPIGLNPLAFVPGTPLVFAARKGDVSLTSRLLAYGADPNFQSDPWGTALRAACSKGCLEVINLLLVHGADPNLKGPSNTRAPLHTSAIWGHDTSCTRALLMYKADPNIQDNAGWTPMHYACSEGHIDVLKCLLESKADASIRNNQGQTALKVAQDLKRENIMQVLGQYGVVE